MSEQTKCPTCGVLLSRHGPDGNCPAHLLGLARMGNATATVSGNTNDPTTIRSFNDYELVEVIARGGMGVVWSARQISLNRQVALKMIRAREFATEAIQRFRTSGRSAGSPPCGM